MKDEKKYLEKKGGYMEAIGRRKSSVARVRIYKGKGEIFSVNNRDAKEYFPINAIYNTSREPQKIVENKFDITVQVKGGGFSSQAEALRHGLARVLVAYDEEKRKEMKDAGFLKRNPKKKERKKFGLRKARRAPQWSKR